MDQTKLQTNEPIEQVFTLFSPYKDYSGGDPVSLQGIFIHPQINKK